MTTDGKLKLPLILLSIVIGLSWLVYDRLNGGSNDRERESKNKRPVPVVTAPVEFGSIALERVFNGTLEAHSEFLAAPKVGGLIENMSLNLGDNVTQGDIVAQLDDAEYVQAVAQAQAELEVARANLAEARSQLEIANRELKRIDQLSASGVSSESQRDLAKANQLAKAAHVEVTLAQLAQAKAQHETARIRLGYTQVLADRASNGEVCVVAERYVDEGENVSAHSPLVKIVCLDPITAVIYVTEKEYAGLHAGQQVLLSTDAYPGQSFSGSVTRIAPVFRETTRQARVEIEISNPEQQLKPGMYIRAKVILAEENHATIVPYQAITRRDQKTGVFILSADKTTVHWRNVVPGIRQDNRIQVIAEDVSGQVVILGQQLLSDGTNILLPDNHTTP